MSESTGRKLLIPAAVIGVAAIWAMLKILKTFKTKILFRTEKQRDVSIIDSPSDWELVYPTLKAKCKNIKAVGFDCEWVFSETRRPVALVQIATYDGFCLLVRIYKMADTIPVTLKQFLSDKSILKIGVSAKDDGKKLWTDYRLSVSGCVDLRFLLSRVRVFRCPQQGLQGLAQGVLGVAMVKNASIRCGNWEAETLSRDQINYAADDALVAMDIFMNLVKAKIVGISQRRSAFYGSYLNVEETDFWSTARSLCQGIVDVAFKNPKKGHQQEANSSDPVELGFEKDFSPKPGRSKESYKGYMARQTPLYYNCRLLAPDGTALTTCDLRKAQWYIDKGLGEKVQDDPVTVRLNFEPLARPTSEEDYYLQEKENQCVVCGATENYIRKLIVPQEYRKYFPSILKDHSAHDVLLMCLDCHQRSSLYDNTLRQKLAQVCDAPLDSGKSSRSRQDQDLQKVVSAARQVPNFLNCNCVMRASDGMRWALLVNRKKLPASRAQELETIVKNFYGVSSVNDELLHRAKQIDTRIHNSSYVPHGKKVVDYYRTEKGGLLEFEKLWRRQFVECLEPKYLPHRWSIDHMPDRLSVCLDGSIKPKNDAV